MINPCTIEIYYHDLIIPLDRHEIMRRFTEALNKTNYWNSFKNHFIQYTFEVKKITKEDRHISMCLDVISEKDAKAFLSRLQQLQHILIIMAL